MKTNKPLIHLNNAAAALPDNTVNTAMKQYIDKELALASTEVMLENIDTLNSIYGKLSTLTGAPEDHIAVFNSNTCAWQVPFLAINLQQGDRVLVGESEWGGNLSTLRHQCERQGASLEVIPSDQDGVIDTVKFSNMLDDRVCLVCVTWASSVSGNINPTYKIASILENSHAWLFVDAAQYFGQISIDLWHPRLDVVTVSARKYLRAPRGNAFTIFSSRFLESIMPQGIDQFSGPWTEKGLKIRKDARKFEYGESPYCLRIGFNQSLNLALNIDWNVSQVRMTELSCRLRSGISSISGINIEDKGIQLSNIVTFSHNKILPEVFAQQMALENINSSVPKYSHAPFWFAAGRPRVNRLSPHTYNTESEIDCVLEIIEHTAKKG